MIRETPVIANRFTGGILQSGNEYLVLDMIKDRGNFIRTPRTLEYKGLTGKGQVLHMLDTGLDVNNTYFFDPINPVSYNTFNDKHRKVAQYDVLIDNTDYNSGHGSHVAGIAVGKASETPEKHNPKMNYHEHDGIAPDARIYVSDGGSGAQMSAKIDFEKTYTNMRKMNSGISTNSWTGSETFEGNCPYDEAAYKYPDILSVFGAGNSNSAMTIGRPATCKNTIAVGNLNVMKGYGVYGFNRKDFIEAPNGTRYEVKAVDYHTQMVSINIVNATLKKNVEEDGEYKSVLLFEGNSRDLENTRQKAENKKYLGIITKEGICNSYFPEKLPCFSILNKNDFNKIKDLPSVTMIYNSTDTKDVGINDKMSSRGPTIIGLSKPDLVAPGTYIISAKGSPNHKQETFEVTALSGTSMATPSISGLALLIRQYFQDGYFPSLKANQNDGMNVTAALIKAVLINSAIPKNPTRSYEPDNTYGFGIPAADKALGFVSGFGVTFEDTNISNGEHRMYTLETKEQRNLTITISYIDTYYTGFSLVYNVDLIVVGPDGKNYSGNHRKNLASDMTTVSERIHIKDVPKGTYKVHVLCHHLKSNSIADSVHMGIAVMGGFDTKKGALVKAQKAECITKTCDDKMFPICEKNKRGNFCQEDIIEFPDNNVTSIEFEPKYTQWIHMKPGDYSDIVFEMSREQNWILDLCKSKPVGQWLYADYNLILRLDRSTSAQLNRDTISKYVDENGEVYLGLTTVGVSKYTMKITMKYNPLANPTPKTPTPQTPTPETPTPQTPTPEIPTPQTPTPETPTPETPAPENPTPQTPTPETPPPVLSPQTQTPEPELSSHPQSTGQEEQNKEDAQGNNEKASTVTIGIAVGSVIGIAVAVGVIITTVLIIKKNKKVSEITDAEI